MNNRIKVRFGDNEIEIEGDPKFVESQLDRFYGRVGGRSASVPILQTELANSKVEAATPTKDLAPAEFLRRVNPKGGTEQLLALAFFIERNRDAKDFTQQDIKALCGEAKIKDLHGQYFTLAAKQGLLRIASKGRYALTLTGEDAVSRLLHRGQGD